MKILIAGEAGFGPSLQVAQASLFKALLPDVVQRPGNAKEPASLTDVPAHALRMLQHAQPGLRFPRLDLLVDWIAYAEPPRWAGRITHLSGMSISSYNPLYYNIEACKRLEANLNPNAWTMATAGSD